MSATPVAEKGLLASLTAMAATLVAIVHTRLDLLASDLEEERAHMYSLLLWSLIAFFCLGVGVVLATILLVVSFWDSHRLLVLAALTGLFLLAGLAALLFTRHKSRTRPRLFSASLAEFLKDRQQLTKP